MSEHPFFFTWTAQNNARPLELIGGEGSRFTTSDGGEWIDLASLTYQANLGHGHPRLIEAVQRQAASLCLATPSSVFPAKTELAERLIELAPPGFGKVFFTLGGSEAIENAIKIARLFTGRHKLMSRYRSYHGATMGALSLSGDHRRPPLEPGLAGVVHVLEPDWGDDDGGRLTNIDRVLEMEGAGSVAAVILESVPGANGVLVAPDGYWQAVRRACDEHGTLLICDEVLTGFGRTGRWFGFENFGVIPDMITLGKAITGGYGPLGAVLVSDRIAKHFDDNMLYAGLTNYGHPLGCAAALEAIKVYEDEQLITRAAEGAPAFRGALSEIQKRHSAHIGELRSIGYLAALDMSGRVDDETWGAMVDALREHRVLTHPQKQKHCLIISPPLGIDAETLNEGMKRLDAALQQAFKGKS